MSIGLKDVDIMTAIAIHLKFNYKTSYYLRQLVLASGYLFQTVHMCTTSAHVLVSLA